MKVSSPFGKASIALGSTGIALAAIARRYEICSQVSRGWVLSLLDALGMLRPPRGVAELSAPGLLSLNDAIAVQHLFRLAVVFGTLALLLLGAAEVRREHNLYPSVGFACAYCAILLVSPTAAVVMSFVAAVAVTLFRHFRA